MRKGMLLRTWYLLLRRPPLKRLEHEITSKRYKGNVGDEEDSEESKTKQKTISPAIPPSFSASIFWRCLSNSSIGFLLLMK